MNMELLQFADEIKCYFTDETWAKMEDDEKLGYLKQCYKHFKGLKKGLEVSTPQFIVDNERRKAQFKSKCRIKKVLFHETQETRVNRPLRNVGRVNYKEADVTEKDEYLFMNMELLQFADEIKCYFTDETWAKMEDDEKLGYLKQCYTHFKGLKKGLEVSTPQFIVDNERRKAQFESKCRIKKVLFHETQETRVNRPLRNVGRVNYKEADVTEKDEYLFMNMELLQFADEIKCYFTDETWAKMEDDEKLGYLKQCYTHFKGLKKGLEVSTPQFIVDNERRKAQFESKCRIKKVLFHETQETRVNRPLRNVGRVNYKEADVTEKDEYLFCDRSQCKNSKYCKRSSILLHIRDRKVAKGVRDRAVKTLPTSLEVKKSDIHGLGVFAKKSLNIGLMLGPYEGNIVRRSNGSGGYGWLLRNGYLVDASDASNSNWMRYVNCSRFSSEQNLVAFQYKGGLYYRVAKKIEQGEELLVFYGKEYASLLGIDTERYFQPKEDKKMKDVYPCDTCCLGFSEKKYLDKHVCRENSRNFKFEGYFVCCICSLTFTLEYLRDDHEIHCKQKHHVYHETVSVGERRKRNRVRNGNKKDKRYKCEKCKYRTEYKHNLILHLGTHSKEKHFKCVKCEKSYSRLSRLNSHVRDIHDGKKREKTYRCNKCKYETNSSFYLNKHIWVHVKENKRFICDVCDKGFTTSQQLRNHQYKHDKQKQMPFQCEECSYSTYHRGVLQRHVIAKHAKEENKIYFYCKQCSYKTIQKSDLKKHSYIHQAKKPFQCTFCSYQCYTPGNLKSHIKRKHSNY